MAIKTKVEVPKLDLLELEFKDMDEIMKDPDKFKGFLFQIAQTVGKVDKQMEVLLDGIQKDLQENNGDPTKKGKSTIPGGKAALQNAKWALSELRQWGQLLFRKK